MCNLQTEFKKQHKIVVDLIKFNGNLVTTYFYMITSFNNIIIT